MLVKYGFKGCVGIIDGDLLLLSRKPLIDGEDVNSRKGGHGVHCLIMCDNSVCIVKLYVDGVVLCMTIMYDKNQTFV